jgi:hypothetical protein
VGVVVDELATVGTRIRAGDRETEAAATAFLAAREAVEELLFQLAGNALACVRDSDTKVVVAPSGADRDRRPPVQDRVRQQVRDHTLDHARVDHSSQVRRHVEIDAHVGRQPFRDRVGQDASEQTG